ncbi:hypothetical protein [Myceligenerans indicum]|uniref:Uncharacterized protein n=1 Tax=Myceligenerans indicum TaxID=2593663 RepID=A0ABS1LM71_9MICO|nr:hypothetical protein [Myceligenerans indicum]MBL0887143.1 hypothetical protein [Myceligenerans indicum]
MRTFLAVLIAIVVGASATSPVAYALQSSTTGGYASTYNWHNMYSCDSMNDGNTFENQSWNSAGQRTIVKDNYGGGCSGLDLASVRVKFRGCRDRIFDNCGPMRYSS